MLKKKALSKILVSTFAVFVFLVVYLLPISFDSKDRVLNIVPEVVYTTDLKTTPIYLLGSNHLLVKTNLLIEGEDIITRAKNIIRSLTVGQNKNLPDHLTGVLPENTKLVDISLQEKILALDFNKEIFQVTKDLEERMIEALVYSLTDLDGVEGITITLEKVLVTELPQSKTKIPEILTKQFGINKVYDIDSRENINKVVLYYIDENNPEYYVPVTKYVNDDREKIQIIVDQLSSSYIFQSNLASVLKQDAELLNYEIDDNLMILDFNDCLFDSDEKILEEVIYTLAYSVFDNYDVNTILFQSDGEEVMQVMKSKLE